MRKVAKILVVDDEKYVGHCLKCAIEELFSEILEIEVILENNPLRALKIVNENSIDVILSDVQMPIMDGEQLIREIRKISPSTNFILITASCSFLPRSELGNIPIIRKPFEESILKKAILQNLELNLNFGD